MSEIRLPTLPRREDPQGFLPVQANVEALASMFTKGTADGDVPIWDATLGKYIAGAPESGGASVATAVSGLPASPSDGDLGRLRVGSSPYAFKTLTYDSTYAKWVSDEEWFAMAEDGELFTHDAITTPLILDQARIHKMLRPWKRWTDAGLTLQIRMAGYLQSNATKACMAQIGIGAVNVGAGGPSYTWQSGTEITEAAGGTTALRESTWSSVSSPSPGDYFEAVPGMYRTSGGAGITTNIWRPTMGMRWIS